LGREVAIKILPRALTADRKRVERFEREARLLAALNHPHIGAIYGVEDADGVPSFINHALENFQSRITVRAASRGIAALIASSGHAKRCFENARPESDFKTTRSGWLPPLITAGGFSKHHNTPFDPETFPLRDPTNGLIDKYVKRATNVPYDAAESEMRVATNGSIEKSSTTAHGSAVMTTQVKKYRTEARCHRPIHENGTQRRLASPSRVE
jgi:hypothetical protein